jgi:uncharacterized protein
MDQIPEEIKDAVYRFIDLLSQRITIDRVVIYGSYAKGSHTKYSDVDIAVFSPDFNGKSPIACTTLLFSIARYIEDVCLEPIGFGNDVWFEDNPFVQEIKRTGNEISWAS